MMASYINVFLKTEITGIPRLLDKYIGQYYNNTLCNGASWMFLFWYILHVLFDDLINALLRKMRYKEYARIRLKKSLWYLGFYTTACVYCCATFYQNDIQFYSRAPFDSANGPSGHLILGCIVMATFYLHSALWERLKYYDTIPALSYLCLFFLVCFSYFLRFVEGTFRLTILLCCTQIALGLTRSAAVLVSSEGLNRRVVCGTLFVCSVSCFTLNYLGVVYFLLDPLARSISPGAATLLALFMFWLVLEIYDSVLFKAVLHWLNHRDQCNRDLFECALFRPRDDATYHLLALRREIKEREEKCLSLRRPKNRNMVMQTLKCMVAIKRKLKEKRHASSSVVDATEEAVDVPEEVVEELSDVEAPNGDLDGVFKHTGHSIGSVELGQCQEHAKKCKED